VVLAVAAAVAIAVAGESAIVDEELGGADRRVSGSCREGECTTACGAEEVVVVLVGEKLREQ
jgi:hypothetical protein